MALEIKIQSHLRKLCISADAEGLADFLASVRYVAAGRHDVMLTSEEWHGELAATPISPQVGRLCERFDMFPRPQNTGHDAAELVFSAEATASCSAAIIATGP